MTQLKNNLYIFILLLMILISIFFIWNFNTGNATKLDEVKLKENNQISKGLAIMLENDSNDGKYAESESSMWPSSTDYRFNKELSGCIDNDGNTVSSALTYDKGTSSVKIKTTGKTYCYLFFDKKYDLSELCSSGDNLGSCLVDNREEIDSLNNNIEGELYRYQGTNIDVDDNYICFGTGDKDECTSNTDAYMYRIIGIDSNGQLKLIKKEALNETMQWHSTDNSEITWPNSTLYSNINGEKFLENTTYMPSGWNDKIVDYSWKHGKNTDNELLAHAIYTKENSWTDTIIAKIGLMYVHDYYYAYTRNGLNCSYNGDFNLCRTSWLHISNNVNDYTNNYEWTMSRYGYNSADSNYLSWPISDDGSVNRGFLNPTFKYVVRPVFYINSDEQYISGDGTIDDPIMLSEPSQPKLFGEYLIENPIIGLNTTTAYGGMYRYIGTTANNYVKLGDVLYRIIGITSENNSTLGLVANQVKVIKAATIGNYNWHGSYTSDTKWESSAMYTYLQGSSVLGSTSVIPSGWSSKISSVKWNIGDVQTYTNGSTIYGLEDNTQTTNTSKVGLMYLSDYYYAYNAGGTTNCGSTVCTNWLTDTSNDTWTMTRYGKSGSNYNAWTVFSYGDVTYAFLTYERAVRPVFYLTNDVYITNPTATGTSTDPFILSY